MTNGGLLQSVQMSLVTEEESGREKGLVWSRRLLLVELCDSESRRLCSSDSEEIMFLVQSGVSLGIPPLRENCNVAEIYRKAVQGLKTAWVEARAEARAMFVQCDANIVHIKQSQLQPRTAGGDKAFPKSHWHSLPKGLENTGQ